MIIDPDELRAGDVVTMSDTFVVREVTEDSIWDGRVHYAKRSQFPEITRVWDLSPGGPVEL